jgi:hypothetical protein
LLYDEEPVEEPPAVAESRPETKEMGDILKDLKKTKNKGKGMEKPDWN